MWFTVTTNAFDIIILVTSKMGLVDAS